MINIRLWLVKIIITEIQYLCKAWYGPHYAHKYGQNITCLLNLFDFHVNSIYYKIFQWYKYLSNSFANTMWFCYNIINFVKIILTIINS